MKRIWMCEHVDHRPSERVERSQYEKRILAAESVDAVVSSYHDECLQRKENTRIKHALKG